jgi:hypothetical protein
MLLRVCATGYTLAVWHNSEKFEAVQALDKAWQGISKSA